MGYWRDVERPADGDWGRLAHEVALRHVTAVQQAEFCAQGECEEHSGQGDDVCPSPAYGIGCNACDDCTVREVLAAAWHVIEAAIRSGDFDTAHTRKPAPAAE